MKTPAFVGPAYQSQSPTAATDRLINLYPESLETSGESAAQSVLLPTPGLAAFTDLPGAPIRALFAQNGRVFAVSGQNLCELFGDGTNTTLGTVAVDAWPATMASNGTAGGQLFIVSGGFGYILTLATNVLTQITSPNFPFPAQDGYFVDSYFAVMKTGTTQWQISAQFDGLTWSGLDVAQRTFATDVLSALVVNHREVWLFGTQTTEVWYDSGDTFPFAPIPGVFIQEGLAARESAVPLDSTIYWLSQSVNGARKVLRAGNGYSPERVSTHAIEFALQGYETVADAWAYAYQDQGHTFYVLNLPSADVTWVYDVATQLWHQRAWFDTLTGRQLVQRQSTHCYGFNQHLVGDRITGRIYTQSITLASDDGTPIRRERRWQHYNDEQSYLVYDALQIDLETGLPIVPTQHEVVLDDITETAWVSPYTGTVRVDAWGGGSSDPLNPLSGAGGGAGGAYAGSYVDVVEGQSYPIAVGAGGGALSPLGGAGLPSSFNTTTVIAAGASRGDGFAGGIGGQASASTGTDRFSGGNGGAPGVNQGAGGGGAGGALGAGANGVAGGGTAGAGGAGGVGSSAGNTGGAGGVGGTGGTATPNGALGSAPGGGAGGGSSGRQAVSVGANGRIRITWETTPDPSVMLRWSNDGGRTWSAERWSSAGLQGDYTKRVIWNRLGQCRDRVFEIAMTTDRPWRLTNAYLMLRRGTR